MYFILKKRIKAVKKIIFVIFIFSVSAFCRGYSLNELVDSAYKHSHLLAIAEMMNERNSDAIDDAKRSMLPKITFSGTYSYGITPYNSMAEITDGQSMTFTQIYRDWFQDHGRFPSFVEGDTIITMMLDGLIDGFSALVPKHSVSGGIDLRQTIFAQNKQRLAVEYARIQGRGLICHWQDVRMKVKANMTKNYYFALISQQRTQIEKQSRDIAKSRHEQTLSLFESHLLSEIDTLNSFIDFSQASVRLSEAKRGEREIFRTIAVSAGISDSVDSMVLTDSLLPAVNYLDYNLLVEHFLAENKDLRALATEVELAEIRVKIAKGDYYPVIYGGLAFNRIAQFNEVKKFDDFNFAPERKLYLGINYDITTFGQRKLRVNQSEYDLKIAKRNFENQKEQLLLVLKSNYETIIEEIAKIEESKKMLDASQKALLMAQDRYSHGLVSQTDMEMAEQRFRNGGLVYLTAVFRYNSLLIDLRIMGADYLYEPLEKAENERFDTFNNYYLRND
jgi:outer membrane protein TolC